MSDGPITGGCLCGSVRFEITEPPFNAGYCHCTRCQRRTGTAASAQARIPAGALRVISGQELVAAYAPGDGGFEKLFCSACGSALFSRHPERHEVMSVRLGALDEDPGLEMEWRQYVAYAASWEPIPDDGVPRYPQARPTGA
ncbi:MAG TPA: GFA family protein [Gaiellales bacterium]|nr:GFA family protein [Gaiellales bacterium]